MKIKQLSYEVLTFLFNFVQEITLFIYALNQTPWPI